MLFADKYSLLSSFKIEFRKIRSTKDAVAIFINYAARQLDECNDVSSLYLDVAKAFYSMVITFCNMIYMNVVFG